jgi:DNA polymerase III subunit gamma/tau
MTKPIIKNIYTDGACKGNPGRGGWGVVIFFTDDSIHELGGDDPHTTNNRMELQAAIAAVEFLNLHDFRQNVTIFCDSKYVIDGISKWIAGWKKKNWKSSKNEDVLNKDLWLILDQLNSRMIKWEYVKAHAGVTGNERADSIASAFAARKSPILKQAILETIMNKKPVDSINSDLKNFANAVLEFKKNQNMSNSEIVKENLDLQNESNQNDVEIVTETTLDLNIESESNQSHAEIVTEPTLDLNIETPLEIVAETTLDLNIETPLEIVAETTLDLNIESESNQSHAEIVTEPTLDLNIENSVEIVTDNLDLNIEYESNQSDAEIVTENLDLNIELNQSDAEIVSENLDLQIENPVEIVTENFDLQIESNQSDVEIVSENLDLQIENPVEIVTENFDLQIESNQSDAEIFTEPTLNLQIESNQSDAEIVSENLDLQIENPVEIVTEPTLNLQIESNQSDVEIVSENLDLQIENPVEIVTEPTLDLGIENPVEIITESTLDLGIETIKIEPKKLEKKPEQIINHYQPLHHKYRPQTFKDLVGQEAIASTLINAICNQKIAPAYLFTGSRGTGKTSSARILAKSLNCASTNKPTPEPCGKCEICQSITRGNSLDIIEIDAASNTGVDNIRELIERAQFAPVQCRYKVYIIDEVHMLSNQAFNALLKTLEEPPERVIFVLATTDPQRVLPTIISRCQRFDYRRIPIESMVKHLRYIANNENININDEAITLVAQFSQGGLRDAESLLDQLSLLIGTIDPDKVWDLVGAVPERDLLALLKALISDNGELVLEQSRKLMDRGREPIIVLQNLASFYRDLLIAKTAPNRHDMVAMTAPTWQELCNLAKDFQINHILQGQKHLKESEVQIKNTTQPRLWLEITLLGLLPSATPLVKEVITTQYIPQSIPQNTPSTPVNQTPAKVATNTPVYQAPPPPPPRQESTPTVNNYSNYQPVETTPNQPIDINNLDQVWQTILNYLPMSSKALLRQQGKLLLMGQKEVIIGMKNHNLLKLAESKKKEIENAFNQAFQQKYLIKIQVGHELGNQGHTSKKNAIKEEEEPEAIPTVNHANLPRENPVIPTEIPQEKHIIEPLPQMDEIEKAARKLIEYFNGEIM